MTQPSGTYVAWMISRRCSQELARWATSMGVVDQCHDHHCTIMHDDERAVDPNMHGVRALPRPWHLAGYRTPAMAPRCVDVLGPRSKPGALVLMLDSPVLQTRYRTWRDDHLLRSDFPRYVPHVTLSYDFARQDQRSMLRLCQCPPPFDLHFDRERVDHCNT